jgi:hypothetical protein
MTKSIWTMLVACAVSGAAIAAEVSSGLEKGAFVPAFTVTDVTGAAKGESLCYRCKFGDRPVVAVFAKKMTPEVAALAKALDAKIEANKDARMAGFLVVTSDAPDTVSSELTTVAEKQGLKTLALTTFKGEAGPKGYKLNPEADVTVMMWVDSAVKVTKGYSAADLKPATIEGLVAETKSILE